MAIRYISKGKGKNRKSFPIRPKKKGVSVRSVSLRPSAVVKVNREQIKLLNRGEPSTFSKALNQVIIRAKRDGIPIYDTHVNTNNRRKPYQMFVTDMKKHKKVKGSDTIVMADNYGQAVDDFITVWNKDPDRMKKPIGYPVVQGTADKSFRYARLSGYDAWVTSAPPDPEEEIFEEVIWANLDKSAEEIAKLRPPELEGERVGDVYHIESIEKQLQQDRSMKRHEDAQYKEFLEEKERGFDRGKRR